MSYKHITIEERSCIYQFIKLGMKIREIASALKRSPSTISRELKRNSTNKENYYPVEAQEKYEKRKENKNKETFDTKTLKYVEIKLQENWSPEQIYESAKIKQIKIPSTATIYRLIKENKLPKIRMETLRRKGKFKRPSETRGKFNDGGRTIRKRDREVYRRKELGHWEGDTIESGRVDRKRKSTTCLVTLVERKSRYCIAIKVKDKTEQSVTKAIINSLNVLPKDLVKTITFDTGKEFAGYSTLECSTYFCNPYCAWQKGTSENTNGLLREYYPKGLDLSVISDEDLAITLSKLNNRPRKCIKFKTPIESLFGHLL